MEIDILIDEELTGAPQPEWLQGIVAKVLTTLKMPAETEMGLVITTQEKIRQLNRDYLKKDEPTDVISFYMTSSEPEETPFVAPPDGLVHLGEVIISYPQAVLQANEHGHSINKELNILIIHGILHLLGYEDEKPELKERMAAKEAEILSIMENR
jgi:probable rRNA maturation factor